MCLKRNNNNNDDYCFSLPDLRVILVNSKVERNTSRMVQIVKEKLKKVF